MKMNTKKDFYAIMKSIVVFLLLVISMSGCSSHSRLFGSDKVIYHEDSVTTRAKFPGGTSEYCKYFNDNFKYPKEAIRNFESGHGIFSFVITKKGKVANVKVEQSVGHYIDKAMVRVIEKMPQWKPATLNDKPVSVRFTFESDFKLANQTFANTNRPAIFPGGYHSFLDEYWNILVTPGMRGNVKVEFIVDETGEVRNPRVIQGLNPRANALALRIVRRMPRWEPAIKKGKPIQSTETISIFFRKGKDDFGTMKDHFAPQNNRR